MPLPSMSEYREALQHPQSAFRSTDLQNGVFEQTPLMIPKLISGGFALTACATTLTSGHRSTWAIRCFHRDAPDLQGRYEHISNFLQSRNEEFFVGFSYELEGIRVRGNWYPIVRMKWVDGQPLDKFIEANLNNNSSCLKNLASQIQLISSSLNKLGMAHGDLQHGNILVRNGKLVLIDYDGMYIPGMPYQKSNELGQPSFQHPKRNQSYFNERIDNFSVIAIYVSLLCLATTKGTELWRNYHNGENLIFSEKDYQDPANSNLFKEIRESREIEFDQRLKQLVDKFKQICTADLKDVPSLDQFLKGHSPEPIAISPISGSHQQSQKQSKTFSAHDISQLLEQEGERITVIGRVSHVAECTKDLDRFDAVFIDFEYLKNESVKQPQHTEYKAFTVIIFSEGLNSLSSIKNLRSSDLKKLKGKYLVITGLLERVQHGHRVQPQIILESAYQLISVSEEKINIPISEPNSVVIPPPPPPPPILPIPTPTVPVKPTPTILCDSCTYHLDNTCNYAHRPYAKTCGLYLKYEAPISYLCDSCSHHLGDTCDLSRRPNAMKCYLYWKHTTGISYRERVKALRLWCRRHQGLITMIGLIGLFVFCLVITIIGS